MTQKPEINLNLNKSNLTISMDRYPWSWNREEIYGFFCYLNELIIYIILAFQSTLAQQQHIRNNIFNS